MLVDVGDTVIVNLKPTVCPVRLVLLDVGITASLSEADKENFRNVFKAVVIGDVSVIPCNIHALIALETFRMHLMYKKCYI